MFGQDDTKDQSQSTSDHGSAPSFTPPPSLTPPSSPDLSSSDNNHYVNALAGDTSAAVPPISSSSPDANGLLDIKQQALQQLSPLVGQLEQSPEEKFRTTMMMIQASDNQSLVKEAFETAKKITDDKTRAQALLDVINEINYFTQQKK